MVSESVPRANHAHIIQNYQMNHKQMQTCQTASGSTMDQLHTSPPQHTQQPHCQEHVLTETSNKWKMVQLQLGSTQ